MDNMIADLNKPHVLLIDDDERFCLAMSKALKRRGFSTEVINESELAVEALLNASANSVAVLDLKMPNLSGLEVLQRTTERKSPVLMLTGHGAIPEAVEAIKAGAYTFLNKPVDAADLEPMIMQAYQHTESQSQVVPFVGESESALHIRHMIQKLAQTDELILIMGRTGTGKEVVARTLHKESRCSNLPFVSVNMSNLPTDDFEACLFGEFNDLSLGRSSQARSILDQVNHGTLFFDEISELNLRQQAKLLQFIESCSYRPLGGTEKRFEGRIIAASCRDLYEAVLAGRFREDLFYRLNGLPIQLSDLKDRDKDAILILQYWFKQITSYTLALCPKAYERLVAYSWPGNAREVVNLARRVAVMNQMNHNMKSQGDLNSVEPDSIFVDLSLIESLLSRTPFEPLSSVQTLSHLQPISTEHSIIGEDLSLDEIERLHVERLIKRYENLSQVARILGVNRRTLQRKLKQWGSS